MASGCAEKSAYTTPLIAVEATYSTAPIAPPVTAPCRLPKATAGERHLRE